jgi:hypothetical protein
MRYHVIWLFSCILSVSICRHLSLQVLTPALPDLRYLSILPMLPQRILCAFASLDALYCEDSLVEDFRSGSRIDYYDVSAIS